MSQKKSISTLTAATIAAAIISMGYQIILSGVLEPDQFALFSVSLSIILIVSYPAVGVSNEFARRVSLPDSVVFSWDKPTNFILVLLFLAILSFFASNLLIYDPNASLIVSCVVFVSLFSNSTNGWWIGRQKFKEYGIYITISAFLRLFFGLVIVLAYPLGKMAILSYGISFLFLPAMALHLFRVDFLGDLKKLYSSPRGLLSAGFSYVILGILMNQDIIAAKLLMSNEQFSLYVYLSLLAKSVLIVHGPVVAVMIPKVVEMDFEKDSSSKAHQYSIFRKYYLFLALFASTSSFLGMFVLQNFSTNWESIPLGYEFILMGFYFFIVGNILIDVNIVIARGLLVVSSIFKLLIVLLPIMPLLFFGLEFTIEEIVLFLPITAAIQLIFSKLILSTLIGTA